MATPVLPHLHSPSEELRSVQRRIAEPILADPSVVPPPRPADLRGLPGAATAGVYGVTMHTHLDPTVP